MSTSDEKKKKRKKERESIIMKEIQRIARISLKQCIDQALEDILKEFNTK